MKQKSLEKAYEITDAKIQFVSLVGKAANMRKFLITKQQDGKASFTTYGKIIMSETKAESHYVTGVVYEPLTEDVHGNFMTEDEIVKACYWYTENGNKVDLQHSFEPIKDAVVVENWVEKADTEINGEPVKKGTWLMTVKVVDDEIWSGIQKGEITGFSMGGIGNYSEEDTDLSSVEKSQGSSEKKSLLKQIARAFGMDVVEKGAVSEIFYQRSKGEQFWTAFDALRSVLQKYDSYTGNYNYEQDEGTIRDALEEFNQIVTTILTAGEPIAKSLYSTKPVEKAGKSLSSKNKEALQGIYDSLGTFLAAFAEPEEKPEPVNDDGDGAEESGTGKGPAEQDELDDDKKPVKKEDTDMTKQEVEGIVQAAVEKAVASLTDTGNTEGAVQKAAEGKEPQAQPEVTAEAIQKMVDEAIRKAVQPQEEPVTAEAVEQMVSKAVGEAIAPILKSHGLPSNLDGEDNNVQKNAEQHYLHGLL